MHENTMSLPHDWVTPAAEAHLIGMKYETAKSMFDWVREVEIDGVEQLLTTDAWWCRANVEVEDGIITRFVEWG